MQCRNRWTNIRDQFRRYLANRQTKSGHTPEVNKKYKYEDLLQFLLPHVDERAAISNLLGGVDKERRNLKDRLDDEPRWSFRSTSTSCGVKTQTIKEWLWGLIGS